MSSTSGGHLAYGTVSVTTSAPSTWAIAGRNNRKSIVIQNTDAANPVYVGGDTSVASTTGVKITAGSNINIDDCSAPIYLRSTGGTVDCRYLEVY